MSGGHFDYKQYELTYIADEIKDVIYRCENDEPVDGEFNYNKTSFPKWFVAEMKDVHDQLLILNRRVQRLDWVLSGDDGVDRYFPRLKEDVESIGDFQKETTDPYFTKMYKQIEMLQKMGEINKE